VWHQLKVTLFIEMCLPSKNTYASKFDCKRQSKPVIESADNHKLCQSSGASMSIGEISISIL